MTVYRGAQIMITSAHPLIPAAERVDSLPEE